ncbi:MAG: kynureninase, partial [Ilumatobacteraceae bacterium]
MKLDDARALAQRLDTDDAIAFARARFDIPDGVLYFDGNSLGPLTHASRAAVNRAVEHEWRERLIRSWDEDWRAMPQRVGNLIAPLIGAAPGTVICADNTSINLHKVLTAAALLRPGRTEIVVDENNFPTDIYIAQSVCDQLGLTLVQARASRIPSVVSE